MDDPSPDVGRLVLFELLIQHLVEIIIIFLPFSFKLVVSDFGSRDFAQELAFVLVDVEAKFGDRVELLPDPLVLSAVDHGPIGLDVSWEGELDKVVDYLLLVFG